jgi:hypothetical protein
LGDSSLSGVLGEATKYDKKISSVSADVIKELGRYDARTVKDVKTSAVFFQILMMLSETVLMSYQRFLRQ